MNALKGVVICQTDVTFYINYIPAVIKFTRESK